MTRAHYSGILTALVCAVAAAVQADDALRLERVPVPTTESRSSLTPHVASSEAGLYMSWLEKTDDGHELVVSRLGDGGFGPPRRIHASDHFFANWADFASVVPFGDGRLVAHWLEKAAEGTYEYDIFMSVSADDGATWSEPSRPHRDGTLSEHGFVSLTPWAGDGFAAVWLDGRETVDEATPRQMTLRFTTHDGSGFADEVLLDGRVCECCQTTMTTTPDGLFVAYRDRSDEEIRDISFVRQTADGWSAPASIHEDGWHLTGCPVNGPQAASFGDEVAVAWFSGAAPGPRVSLALSMDRGRSFGEPIRIDDGSPIGRVDVEWMDGQPVVSWLEKGEGRGSSVRVKRVSRSGAPGPSVTVAETGSSRASGFPRMTMHPSGGLLIAWTESFERRGPSSVAAARLTSAPELLDEPAIAFDATGVDGRAHRLSDYAGKTVLVNFWGIWCKSCREEIPLLVELANRYADDGLIVLGADYGDEPSDLPRFIEDVGMTYPVPSRRRPGRRVRRARVPDERAHRRDGPAPVPLRGLHERKLRVAHARGRGRPRGDSRSRGELVRR